jgi:hypothetical protein
MAKTMLRKLALLAFLSSLACSAAALTVSIVPSEGKGYAPPPDGSGSPLRFLVSGCLDRLFDAGYVVTDANADRVSRSDWGLGGVAAGILEEAREGLVDYIIALYVDWMPSTFHKDVLLPASIEYRLVRVADGKVMIDGDTAGSSDSEESSSHFDRTASQAGAKAALPCVEILKALAMGGE